MRSSAAGLALVVLGLMAAGPVGPKAAAAQDLQEVVDVVEALLTAVSESEFNFSNPGARSLAMGGAFLGRPDDASAAYANPAGLVEMHQPEASVEIRNHTVTARIGPQEGGVPSEADLDTLGILFASLVYPRDRWAVAAYRFELAGYTAGDAAKGTLTGDAVTLGLAGAYRFDNGLSVGAVLVHNEAAIETTCPLNSCRVRAEDTTVVANIGLLWRLNEVWSVGAVFRQGPEFGLAITGLPTELASVLPTLRFKVPDVVGLGVGWRSSRLVLNVDLVRVLYSQYLSSLGGTITNPFPSPHTFGQFLFGDVDEIHFGSEYSFWNARGAPAIRFGMWFDPAHKVRFVAGEGLSDTEFMGISEQGLADGLAERFAGGKDRLHVSAGFGFVFGRRFQLDAGVDISDQTETFSVSTLVRF